MKRKRRVLSVWATLALVFVGLSVIAGATVLALYLMGNFNNEGVAPGDDLTFVMDGGLGHMEGQGDDATFYISENSSFVVSTGVEGVTQKELTLYFDSSLQKDVENRPGYITDGIIIVKERARIGEEFAIEVAPDRNYENSPNGGISTLHVKSVTNNYSVTDRSCRIVVDVPVEKSSFSVSINGQEGDTQTVIVGVPSFQLEPVFAPVKSGYYFADPQKAKMVFFSPSTSVIEQDEGFAYNEFRLNTKVNNIVGTTQQVRYYTFKNSEYQREFVTELATRGLSENSNWKDISEFFFKEYSNGNSSKYVYNDINIRIEGVSVTDVTIDVASPLAMRIDKNFHLTTKTFVPNTKDFGTLSAAIMQDGAISSDYVNSLYANIGIKVPVSEGKVREGFKISGGDVIEVDKDGEGWKILDPETLTIEQINDILASKQDSIFYVLPKTSNIPSPSDYYWEISSEKEVDDLTLEVNFFEEKSGNWQAFFKLDGEDNSESSKKTQPSFKVSATLPQQDSPEWKDQDTLSLTITTGAEENDSARENLSSLLEDISLENVYRTVRYFLIKPFVTDADKTFAQNFNASDYFEGIGDGKDYTTYYGGTTNISIVNAVSSSGYTLYEFTGNQIVAKKELPTKVSFYIVAMLVRTDADGNITKEDDKYQIINNSVAKRLEVDSTLSIKNMAPTFSIEEPYNKLIGLDGQEQATGGNYYIPANVSTPEEGNNLVKFKLTLNNVSEKPTSDSDDKVLAAFTNGANSSYEEAGTPWLRVVAMAETRELDSITLNISTLKATNREDTGDTLTYEGTFTIDPDAFRAKENEIDSGTRIALELRYYNGKEVSHVTLTDGSSTDHFYVYAQQPQKIEFNKPVKEGITSEKPCVSIIIDEDDPKIYWNTLTGDGTIPEITQETQTNVRDLSELKELLSFSIIDRFGRVIDPATSDYMLRLEEAPKDGESSGLLPFNLTRDNLGDTFRATATQGETTTLVAKVVNAKGEYQTSNGSTSGTPIVCETEIKFFVQSIGINKIEVDTSRVRSNIDEAGSDDQLVKTYVEKDGLQTILSKSMIEVYKYVTKGTTITFTDLLKFYTAKSENAINIKVGVSAPFYSDLLKDQREDLQKMLTLDNQPFAQSNSVKMIEFKYPFGDDNTYLDFTVSDEKGNLFSLTLRIHILSNITLATNFGKYASDKKYSDYLVKSAEYVNAAPVFAGETLSFDDYMVLGKNSQGLEATYNWSDYFKSEEDFKKYLDFDSGFEYDTSPTSIKIKERYSFETITFTIYYGEKSQYALHQTISLYVNPNVILVKNNTEEKPNPYVGLNNIASQKPKDNYTLYKFTEYIDNGLTHTSSMAELDSLGENFVYQEDEEQEDKEQYISIDGENDKYVFAMNEGMAKTIVLNFGQKFVQKYSFTVGSGENLEALECAQVDCGKLILGKEDTPVSLSIEFGIDQNADNGFVYAGKYDSTQDKVTPVSGVVVPAVEFEKDGEVQTYIVLEPFTTIDGVTTDGYYIKDDYTILSASGLLSVVGENKAKRLSLPSSVPFLSLENNSFTVEKTLEAGDSKLNVSLSINVIITGMGKDNVYYSNNEAGDGPQLPTEYDKMEFNKFGDATYDVLLGEWTKLEHKNVYQVLNAGKTYNLVHNLYGLDEAAKAKLTEDPFGFYYNSFGNTTTTINAELTILRATVGGKSEKISDDKKKTNLASVDGTKLTLNHLEKSINDAYIILQLTLKETGAQGRTFSWNYRIKVSPSFTLNPVMYPYGEDGEYLDNYSTYYKGDHYEIPLEEEYNLDNSKHTSGQRFGDLTFSDTTEVLNAEKHYEIASAYLSSDLTSKLAETSYSTFFTYKFENTQQGTVLNIDVKNQTVLTIFVRRYLVSNGMKLLGSEQEYKLCFNQMPAFEHSLKYEQGEANDQTLTAQDDVYDNVELLQGETGVFTPKVTRKEATDRESDFYAYDTYIDGKDGSIELHRQMYIKSGAQVTKLDEKGADKKNETLVENKYFDSWMTDADAQKLLEGAKPISETDEKFVEVTIGGVRYQVKVTDIAWNYKLGSENIATALMPYVTYNGDSFWASNIETTDGKLSITKKDGGDKVDNIEISDITWKYILQNDTAHTLTLNAQTSVTKDHYLTIGVYSKEKTIFKIKLKVTSVFKIDYATEFDGGEEYGTLVTKGTSGNVENVILYIQKKESGTYSNYTDAQNITFELLNGDETVDFGREGITKNDLWKKDSTTNKITFAELLSDVEFKFMVTITESGAVVFTFPITITVKKSYSYPTKDFTDSRIEYAGYAFDVTLTGAFADNANTIEQEFGLNGKTGFSLLDSNNSGNVSITPEDVATDNQQQRKALRIKYSFEDKDIFDFDFNFIYYVYRSVEVKTNYPDPAADTGPALDVEYVGTAQVGEGNNAYFESETIQNFFGTQALFTAGNRVAVGYTENFKRRYEQTSQNRSAPSEDAINKTWKYSISSMEDGLIVYVNDNATDTPTTINASGAISLKFRLKKDVSRAKVVFNVSVNGVPTEYAVTVVQGDVVRLVENPTNYEAYGNSNAQAETIYVEDLNQYLNDGGDTKLFAQERLTTYKLLQSQVGHTLYARFVDTKNQGIVAQLKTDTAEKIYFDMGKSLSEYKFDAIYTGNDNGSVSGELKPEQVFDIQNDGMIRKTSRLVAMYGPVDDATEILADTTTQDNTRKVSIKDDSNEAANIEVNKISNYDVTNHVTNHVKTYNFELTIGAKKYAEVNYSIRTATELLVEGNANEIKNNENPLDKIKVQEITAGTTVSLMSLSGFGFKNAKTKQAINKISDSATIGLGIYGFSGTPVEQHETAENTNEKLSNTAYVIDNYLKTAYAQGKSDIDYYTGLAPRYGMENDLNTNPSSDSPAENYLMYYGVEQKDYNIAGQHCTNDGNYVMIKMDYTVNWGNDTVTDSNNLLFKVIPGSSMTVEYKSSPSSTEYTDSGLDKEVINGRTYVSNVNNPYVFSLVGNNESFYFVQSQAGSTQAAQLPVIKISRTGDQNWNEKNYTYTYWDNAEDGLKSGSDTIYNDFTQFANKLKSTGSDGGRWTQVQTSNEYNRNGLDISGAVQDVKVPVPMVTLGTKNFYITYKDVYGYQGIFYFSIESSDVNPVFADNSVLSLTEGEGLVFSAAYQEVSIEGRAGNWITYSGFTYEKDKNLLQVATGNTAFTITGLKMTATLKDGRIFTKGDEKSPFDAFKTAKSGSNEGKGGEAIEKPPKTISDLEIWSADDEKDTGWKLQSGKGDGLTKEDLDGATIVFEFQYEGCKAGEKGDEPYKVGAKNFYSTTYNGVGLKQTHTIGQTHIPTKKELGIGKGNDATPIAIGGIGAYAYDTTLGALDKNSLENTVSKFLGVEKNVNDNNDERSYIFVSKVEFKVKHGNSKINVSSSDPQTQDGGKGATLLTNESKFFFVKDSDTTQLIQGTKYGEGSTNVWTVPAVKGYLYGTNDSIANVEMVVTLTYKMPLGSSANNYETQTAQIVRNVTISKTKRELFKKSVLDGEPVTKNVTTGPTVYNNTLEVTLPGKTRGNITITPTTDNMAARTFEVENKSDWTVTKYYPIIVGEYNYQANNITTKTFTAVISQREGGSAEETTGITMKYNNVGVSNNTATAFVTYNDNITLRINDPSELSGDVRENAHKTEQLYFLYNESNTNKQELYRVEPEFEVYLGLSSLQEQEAKSVLEYLKVGEGENCYYVIPYQEWAGMFHYNRFDGIKLSSNCISEFKPYKLYFDIDTSAVSGGSLGGAAYIDENGTITTTTAFDPTSDGLAVNIYANISGNDGMYEYDISKMTNKEKMYVGTAKMALNHIDDWKEEASIGSDGIWQFKHSSDGEYAEEVVYQYLIASNNEVYVSSAREPTITAEKKLPESGTISPSGIHLSAAVGEKVDLRKLFGSIDTGILHNKHYHMVAYKEGESSETYVPYNNVDYYTFANTGTYTLTILATGRGEKGTFTEKLFTVEMTVYSNTASALQYTKVVKNGDGFTLNSLDTEKFTDDVEWFKLDKTTNSLEKISDSDNYSIDATFNPGLNKRSFLAQVGTTTYLVDVDFWVYDNTTETGPLKDDKVNSDNRTKLLGVSRSNYRLDELFAPTTQKGNNYSYTIYKLQEKNNVLILGDKITYEEGFDKLGNPSVNRKYLVVENSRSASLGILAEETVSNCFVYDVTYYFTQNTQSAVQTIKREADGTVAKTNVENALKEVFGVQASDSYNLFVRNVNTGELSQVADISAREITGYTFTKEFVCVKKGSDGKVTSVDSRQVLFYVYDYKTEKDKDVNIHTYETNMFYTAQLNAYVKEEAAAALNGATVNSIDYYEFQNATPMSEPTLYFILNQNTTKHFYIIVNATVDTGAKQFYLDMTFNFQVGIPDKMNLVATRTVTTEEADEETGATTSKNVLEASAILSELKQFLEISDESAELYKIDGQTLTKLTENIELTAEDLQKGYISGVYGIKYTAEGKANYVFTDVKIYFHESQEVELSLTLGLQNLTTNSFATSGLTSLISTKLDLTGTTGGTTYTIDPNYREFSAFASGCLVTENVNSLTVNWGTSTKYLIAKITKTTTADDVETKEYLFYKVKINFVRPSASNNYFIIDKPDSTSTPKEDVLKYLMDELKVSGVTNDMAITFYSFGDTLNDEIHELTEAENLTYETVQASATKTYLACVTVDDDSLVYRVTFNVQKGE